MKKVDVNFGRTGFVKLTYPKVLREAVVKAMESWKGFCDLPLDVKMSLPYSNGADGVGYEFKPGEGLTDDRKENFDVTIAGQDWLRDRTELLRDSGTLDFVTDSVQLVRLMKPLIMRFADAVEEQYGISGFAEEVDASEAKFFVRFIHYLPDERTDEDAVKPGDPTATAHVDQSGFTLHLFESAPGLQCLWEDHETAEPEWMDMPVHKGTTVIIPAMQLQLRSEGKLTALAHRVVATKKTAKTGRYSAVCFVQLKNTPKYDKERCGRLQLKKPGFNYGMKPKTFAKLFK
ncbi:MAG: 2OG-Fe(II) oxygenase family protein [Patescibacteria group bacterium]